MIGCYSQAGHVCILPSVCLGCCCPLLEERCHMTHSYTAGLPFMKALLSSHRGHRGYRGERARAPHVLGTQRVLGTRTDQTILNLVFSLSTLSTNRSGPSTCS